LAVDLNKFKEVVSVTENTIYAIHDETLFEITKTSITPLDAEFNADKCTFKIKRKLTSECD
jgi:hypothetical protein